MSIPRCKHRPVRTLVSFAILGGRKLAAALSLLPGSAREAELAADRLEALARKHSIGCRCESACRCAVDCQQRKLQK